MLDGYEDKKFSRYVLSPWSLQDIIKSIIYHCWWYISLRIGERLEQTDMKSI